MTSSIEIKTRRVSITDETAWKNLPKHNIAETPGGTMFGTTPGGTRIIYDRLFMLAQKNSPVARTPPKLPKIPGVTSDLKESTLAKGDQGNGLRTIEELPSTDTNANDRTHESIEAKDDMTDSEGDIEF